MAFNFDLWKEATKQKLQGWKGRMDRAGVNSAYYFLAGVSLIPIVRAVHSGDWSGLAVMGASLGGAVSTNLLANIVQKAKDKSEAEVAKILEDEVKATPELKAEIDTLLQKLDALQEAEKALSAPDKAWFVETIQRELKRLNSGIKYEAKLIGSGAIAQGDGARAVGAGGIMIGGNVTGNFIAGDKNRVVQTDTYIEKQVFEALSKTDPEVEKRRKSLEKYLNRLSRVCLSLPLAALGGGDGDESDITLDKVYIALNTTLSHEHIEEASERQKKEGVIGLTRRPEKDKPITALESVSEHKRLALLGDPGAGKSTFVKNLLAWQAGALLGKLTPPTEGIKADLVPVLIILRDMAPRLARLDVDSLPAYQRDEKLAQTVWEQIQADLGEECADFCDVLYEALQSGECLLVLDGLDEVPHDLRFRVRQAVDALFKQYHLQRVIITCRVRSYVGDSVLPNFTSRTLAPFNEEQIGNFIQHWYNTQRDLGKFNEEQAKARMNDLARAALENDMRELSSNPMLLTTMVIIHQREVGLPRERVRLYHQAVEVLLRRWQKHKVGDAALAEFLKNDLKLRAVMEVLAYQAHRASAEQSGTGTLLRKDALDLLEKGEHLGDVKLAADFLDYVDQRAGLLVGYGGELTKPTSYSFPHRTFQEYLAGSFLAGQRDRVRTFHNHAAEGDSWDIAAQLAFEEMYYNRRGENELLDLAYQLDKPDGKGEQCERVRLWAGQIIALVGKEVAERDTHPNGGTAYLSRLLPGLVYILGSDTLPPLERAEAGRVLASLGDPREEIMTLEKMVFCRVPVGEFRMGEGKEEHEVDLPEFFISRSPISNAQFDQFVKAEGYKQEKYWQEAEQAGYWSEAGFKGRFENETRNAPVDIGAPFNLSNHPVVGASWYEALAFTRWLTEYLQVTSCKLQIYDDRNDTISLDDNLQLSIINRKSEIYLPSEAEWEKASRGLGAREYPWEGKFNPNFANVSETGIGSTSAIGCFPKGKSPYGVLEMSGNVWEWTRTNSDGKEDFQSKDDRVLTGGSFDDDASLARCVVRLGDYPDLTHGDYGFRVVVVSPVLPSRRL
ncbi:MAG: SUMF1/EgtB/PvdO family nonheme iron enzyme [Chloroflexi bacterium]|nr:SUMF1/EgtB/PvdO family nonheme iron enzyme [Chloroflexota bacterium]